MCTKHILKEFVSLLYTVLVSIIITLLVVATTVTYGIFAVAIILAPLLSGLIIYLTIPIVRRMIGDPDA